MCDKAREVVRETVCYVEGTKGILIKDCWPKFLAEALLVIFLFCLMKVVRVFTNFW